MLVKERNTEHVRQTQFVRQIKRHMLELDLEGPTDLNQYLKEVRAIDRDRYPIIRSILRGATKPEPWFVTTIINGLNLNEEETTALMRLYFESYGVADE